MISKNEAILRGKKSDIGEFGIYFLFAYTNVLSDFRYERPEKRTAKHHVLRNG
jgi:hypothetical protein